MRKLALFVLMLGMLSGTAFAANAAPWPTDGSQLTFVARLKDKPTGTLAFNFSQTADGLVEKRVEHLEFTKFMVKAVVDQTTISTWRGQVLESISSSTALKSSLKDMDTSFKASRTSSGTLQLMDSEGKKTEIPADVWPLSFPGRASISHAQFFELGKGDSLTVQSKSAGTQMMEADGGSQMCERVEANLDQGGKKSEAVLWYDSQGRLCAIQYKTDVGIVDYVRTKAK